MSKKLLIAVLVSASLPVSAQTGTEKTAVTSYLSVAYLGPEKGLPGTPQTAYSCAFDKSSYAMREPGLVTVKLLDSTEPRFEIISLRVNNDFRAEFTQRNVGNRSASIYGANKTAQTIYFSVFVRDLQNGQIIDCDPQVICIPTKPGVK